MIWLNPSALFALAALAAPILIHILIQRRAERVPFPTLRFLQPTRLAAIRRHLLEDLPLLAVRALILAAAAAALAGPLFVTSMRRQAWDRRVVRAVVGDESAPTFQASDTPMLQQRFEGPSLADGIRRAVLWLDTTPPARREIVIAAALAIGSITPSDIALIPPDIGVRFARTAALPATRTVAAGRLLTTGGVRARQVTFDGVRTIVRDTATDDPAALPIDVVSSAADRPTADAALAAVLSQRVWAAPPDRRARLVLLEAASATASATALGENGRSAELEQPWMAAAVDAIARDRDYRIAAARVATGLADRGFTAAPWQTLAVAADGRPVAVAAGSPDRLVVATAAPAADIATPLLVRAIADAMAPAVDLQAAEVVPIPDAELRRWTRPSAPVVAPRIDAVEPDDRRWLWLLALGLLALETWMRRPRAVDVAAAGEEHARVA